MVSYDIGIRNTLLQKHLAGHPQVMFHRGSIPVNVESILNPISVTFEGAAWAETVNYTYDVATGAFATLPGQITVPAATYTQDPVTGAYTMNPGIATLVVTGTI